jgi:uncharacterized membrane protein
MRRLVLGLVGLLVSACGDDVLVGGPRPQDQSDGGDSGFPEGGDSGIEVDSAAPDTGSVPHVDSSAPFFHLIEPTAAHVQRAAGDPSRLQTRTAPGQLSADGSVVMLGLSTVFESAKDGLAQGEEVFRWTEATGTIGLGFLPPCERTDGFLPFASPSVMNSDGSVILGYCFGIDSSWLFRWTQASGLIGVAGPPGLPEDRWGLLTADGSVAAGYATPADGDDTHVPQVFRWTQATGAVALGTLAGTTGSYPYGGMTPDGKTIVGQSGDDIFRWTEAMGMVGLPRPSGFDRCLPAIRQVSADGTIVAGSCSGPSGSQFFRWKGTAAPVMVPLPPGASAEVETGMTPDGATIFSAFTVNDTTRAFRWTEPTGTVEISLPNYKICRIEPGMHPSGRVVSADGTALTGNCRTPFENGTALRGAFRWTKESGAVVLRPLPGDDGAQVDTMSADGSIIVGQSLSPGPDPVIPKTVAVIWDATGKPTAVGELFTSLGIDLKGFKPWYVKISPTDGHLISGAAENAAGVMRAFVARLP